MLKCCLLQYRYDLTETCYIFYICLYVWVLIYLCLIYMICFFISLIDYIILLRPKNLLFGHVSQKFSLRVLLSVCLIFCQFQTDVAYKSLLIKSVYRQIVIERNALWCFRLNFKTAKNLCSNLQKSPLPSKILGYAPKHFFISCLKSKRLSICLLEQLQPPVEVNLLQSNW